MSSTPNVKRRRVEHASNALSKPFKSPLRRPTSSVKEEAKSPKIEDIASPNTSPYKEEPTEQKVETEIPQNPATHPLPTPPSSRKRPFPGQRLASARKPVPIDPEITGLQRQQRDLHSRLTGLRSELDTVQQALRIESSNRDDELEALIVKWKKVSQEAAEEVFTGAQERIARMGGVKAWRERMKNADTRWEQEEMESWFGNVDAEALDLDDEEVSARKAELREEMEKKNAEEQGDESEVCFFCPLLLVCDADFSLGVYDGYDAEDAEYRAWDYWV